VVPLAATPLLSVHLTQLSAVVAESEPVAGAASRGFACRLQASAPDEAPVLIERALADAVYGGIPDVAFAGFLLGIEGAACEASIAAFIREVERIRGRPKAGRDQLAGDDIAVLGIATGLAQLAAQGRPVPGSAEWLIGIADGPASGPDWTRRARALAADLLDKRGRLRADVDTGDIDDFALDLCLRRAWPAQFQGVGYPERSAQQELLARMLAAPQPVAGELERSVVWLTAANALVRAAALDLAPDFDRVVEFLERTQGALKRWVWDEKSVRQGQGVAPAQWLIDSEAHVQAFLWAMLYPAFGDQLRDEQYLPGYGMKQPRYDFGIVNLKLIIEVKILRTPAHFKEVEEQIAGDTGVYFSDPSRFDKMVVYIYDDCDTHQPERYDSLRAAILQRDQRVRAVIIVRRPGMLPNRNSRKAS
jgi:hypothetical protein